MAQAPVIINIAFEEMYPRMAQCGYRHVIRVRDDITALQRSMPPPLTAHIAQVSGHPPLFMVKGPLLAPADLRGQPQVEYVVTLTQAFPNSYPIITIEGPPQGWTFKRHPNVDTNGCCFLQSISRWDPRSSHIVPCIQELQAALRANHPFQPSAQAQPPAPVQPPAQAQPPPPLGQKPQPPLPPPVQQPTPAPMPPPLGGTASPTIAMPPQTLAVGTMIFGATNAASERTDPEMQHRREQDQQWLADYQRRAQVDPSNREFVTRAAQFGQMVSGQASRPGATVDCPLGFGFSRIMTGNDASLPLRSLSGVPPPLPPCQDPTPDQHYRNVEDRKAVERAQREAQAQSQPKATGTFGSLTRALNIGAAVVSNLASQAASSVESEVRRSEYSSELRRFGQFFPQFVQEHLNAEYRCSSLLGNGLGVPGLLYITDVGVHFTTKRADGLPPSIAFQFDMSYNQIASLVKGSALSFEWLHLVYHDGQFRSVYNVTTSTAASIGELVSSSVAGTAFSRMYSWIDHKWRAACFGGGGVQLPPAPVAGLPVVGQVVPPASSAPPPEPTESTQCVICMERMKNQFFQPCGHVCVCQVCVANVRECPLCRTPIQHAFQAFL